MDFYSLNYVIQQAKFNQLISMGTLAVGVIALIVAIIFYYRHQTQNRYRDLAIFLALLLAILVLVQTESIQQHTSQTTQATQLKPFFQSLARKYHTTPNRLYVNSLTYQDGMVVKIKRQYYQVNLGTNTNTYSLQQVQLTNSTVKYHH